MFCIAPGIKWNDKMKTYTYTHIHTHTCAERGEKGREGVMAILGCPLDYFGMNYSPEVEGTPVIQILYQKDKLPLILILRLEDTDFWSRI